VTNFDLVGLFELAELEGEVEQLLVVHDCIVQSINSENNLNLPTTSRQADIDVSLMSWSMSPDSSRSINLSQLGVLASLIISTNSALLNLHRICCFIMPAYFTPSLSESMMASNVFFDSSKCSGLSAQEIM
jgi:hypothetical protein